MISNQLPNITSIIDVFKQKKAEFNKTHAHAPTKRVCAVCGNEIEEGDTDMEIVLDGEFVWYLCDKICFDEFYTVDRIMESWEGKNR